jgi:outer membrane murein-binding lipoprotein Lpp
MRSPGVRDALAGANLVAPKEDIGMKRTWFFVLLVAAVAVVAFAGCGEKKETTQAATAAKAFTPEQRTKYMTAVADSLDSYKMRIEHLQMRAGQMMGEAHAGMHEQMQALHDKQQHAEQMLDQMKTSSGDAWMDMMAGMDRAMDDLGQTYRKAAADLK